MFECSRVIDGVGIKLFACAQPLALGQHAGLSSSQYLISFFNTGSCKIKKPAITSSCLSRFQAQRLFSYRLTARSGGYLKGRAWSGSQTSVAVTAMNNGDLQCVQRE